ALLVSELCQKHARSFNFFRGGGFGFVQAPEFTPLTCAALNSVITAVPSEPEPALVLAYDQWGDASRDDEIVTRNRVPNPLFTGGIVRMTEN
ncbi:MAG: hypothetical protein SPL30_08950, partial [Succinivibrio sp.]|nr:hypothetical protein [Succinivibrio sp.]